MACALGRLYLRFFVIGVVQKVRRRPNCGRERCNKRRTLRPAESVPQWQPANLQERTCERQPKGGSELARGSRELRPEHWGSPVCLVCSYVETGGAKSAAKAGCSRASRSL